MPKGKWNVLIDLTGQRFGRLAVLRRDFLKGSPRTVYWICQCDCGQIRSVAGCKLKDGSTASCGCLNIERTRKANSTHGLSHTSLYRLWTAMHERCTRANHSSYNNYGARGIYVCDRWKNFLNFKADMGERPDNTSLERKDNNGPYSPENCCWATPKQQRRNSRRTVTLSARGKTQLLIDWADELGIPYQTLQSRLNRGWHHEKVLFSKRYARSS